MNHGPSRAVGCLLKKKKNALAMLGYFMDKRPVQKHSRIQAFERLEAFKVYYAISVSMSSLHRESTDSLTLYLYTSPTSNRTLSYAAFPFTLYYSSYEQNPDCYNYFYVFLCIAVRDIQLGWDCASMEGLTLLLTHIHIHTGEYICATTKLWTV